MIKTHLEKIENYKNIIDEVLCNKCGNPIHVTTNLLNKLYYSTYEDTLFEEFDNCLSIYKIWGYNSNKDGEEHSFHMCESCYDEFISTFKIPPNIITDDL